MTTTPNVSAPTTGSATNSELDLKQPVSHSEPGKSDLRATGTVAQHSGGTIAPKPGDQIPPPPVVDDTVNKTVNAAKNSPTTGPVPDNEEYPAPEIKSPEIKPAAPPSADAGKAVTALAKQQAKEIQKNGMEAAKKAGYSSGDPVADYLAAHDLPKYDYGNMTPKAFFETELGKRIKADPEAMKAYTEAFNEAIKDVRKKFAGIPGMAAFFKTIDTQVAFLDDIAHQKNIMLSALGVPNNPKAELAVQQVQDNTSFPLSHLIEMMKPGIEKSTEDLLQEHELLKTLEVIDRKSGQLDLNHIRLDRKALGAPVKLDLFRFIGDGGRKVPVTSTFKIRPSDTKGQKAKGKPTLVLEVKAPGVKTMEVPVNTVNLHTPEALRNAMLETRQQFARHAFIDRDGEIKFDDKKLDDIKGDKFAPHLPSDAPNLNECDLVELSGYEDEKVSMMPPIRHPKSDKDNHSAINQFSHNGSRSGDAKDVTPAPSVSFLFWEPDKNHERSVARIDSRKDTEEL